MAIETKPEVLRNAALLTLTANIVAAHAAKNALDGDALQALIRQTYQTLAGIETGSTPVERPQPAVAIKKSVTNDFIVCLEDGKKLKMLKRHLKSAYNTRVGDQWGSGLSDVATTHLVEAVGHHLVPLYRYSIGAQRFAIGGWGHQCFQKRGKVECGAKVGPYIPGGSVSVLAGVGNTSGCNFH